MSVCVVCWAPYQWKCWQGLSADGWDRRMLPLSPLLPSCWKQSTDFKRECTLSSCWASSHPGRGRQSADSLHLLPPVATETQLCPAPSVEAEGLGVLLTLPHWWDGDYPSLLGLLKLWGEGGRENGVSSNLCITSLHLVGARCECRLSFPTGGYWELSSHLTVLLCLYVVLCPGFFFFIVSRKIYLTIGLVMALLHMGWNQKS